MVMAYSGGDCCGDDFPHVVTIIPSSGHNEFGEQVPANGRRAAALIEPGKSMQRIPSQEHQDRSTTIIVRDINIGLNDTIVLPDGTQRIVASVATYDYDLPDMAHSVVTIS